MQAQDFKTLVGHYTHQPLSELSPDFFEINRLVTQKHYHEYVDCHSIYYGHSLASPNTPNHVLTGYFFLHMETFVSTTLLARQHRIPSYTFVYKYALWYVKGKLGSLSGTEVTAM